MLISKICWKPATIGVVMSCAMPHTVKQPIRDTNSTSMPLPTSRSCGGWASALAAAVSDA